MNKKIINSVLLSKIKKLNKHRKIVLCHGVFDLLHIGHIRHFKEAKKHGDILVVSITTDKYVNKGPNRPYFNVDDRAMMISSIEEVDYVFINNNQDAINVLKILKPNFYIKGKDYKKKSKDLTKKIYEEETAVKRVGGKIIFTSSQMNSASTLLNKFFIKTSENQKKYIDKIKTKYEFEYINKILLKIKNIKALVIGETIIDRYIETKALGLGSKSPIVAAQILNQNDYLGGSAAILNHLLALNSNSEILMPANKSDNKYLKKLKNKNIFLTSKWKVPVKTRFLENFKNRKIFEVQKITNKIWDTDNESKFIKKIGQIIKRFDLILIADFGHGLFSSKIIDFIEKQKKFKSANVQTNSYNYGFNLITKYKNLNYFCIDKVEMSLATQDNTNDINVLNKKLLNKMKKKTDFCITRGKDGASMVKQNKLQNSCPVMFADPVDTVGAGDAFFTLSSVLKQMKVEDDLNLFLSNCYAGLKTRVIGNSRPVTLLELQRAIDYLLK